MHQTKVGLSLGRSYFPAFLLSRSWLRVLRFCDLQSSQRQSEEIFVTFMACFMMLYQRTNIFLLFSSPLCSNLIILGRAIIEAHVAEMESAAMKNIEILFLTCFTKQWLNGRPYTLSMIYLNGQRLISSTGASGAWWSYRWVPLMSDVSCQSSYFYYM